MTTSELLKTVLYRKNDFEVYNLDDLIRSFSNFEILCEPDNCADFYVFFTEKDNILNFAFFSVDSETSTLTRMVLFAHGTGITGNLQECRHIYFGDLDSPGYMYYLCGSHMNKMLKWLSSHFDLS